LTGRSFIRICAVGKGFIGSKLKNKNIEMDTPMLTENGDYWGNFSGTFLKIPLFIKFMHTIIIFLFFNRYLSHLKEIILTKKSEDMSILLIGEDRFVEYLQASLANNQIKTKTSNDLNKAYETLKTKKFKVIVCAFPFQTYKKGEDLLHYLLEASPTSNIIFIAEDIRVYKAIELVKKGLFTCLKKPFLIENLIYNINLALNDNRLEVEAPAPRKRTFKTFEGYVMGKSAKAKKMYEQISLVGPTNFNVIIYGETGTGKESVAHRLMLARGDESPYVAVDCGCLSRELAASELFGHEKGSFTGAAFIKKGAFERADKGTLFLDEIGNLDYEVQTYLLRAIQERKIRKVGGEKDIHVDVRILVASNENLAEKVKKGEFREDLYHRLNEFEISIPPLRERQKDIQLFIDYFIEEVNGDLNKNIKGIDEEAFELLYNYEWPGNIRELKNTIRRSALMTPHQGYISKEHLPKEFLMGAPMIAPISETQVTTENPPSHYLKNLMEQAEIEQIMSILKKVNYNKTKAAVLLNMDRKTLYNKLKKFR
jgi:two-component system response regulator HydG